MNESKYLQWFTENLQLASSFFSGALHFSLIFCAGKWHAGYSYHEDYDGNYFLDSLKGTGKTALDALDKSYDKTLPVVIRLYDIRQRFNNPEKFIKDEKYTIIMLGCNGDVQIVPVVGMGPEKHGRGEVFQSELGHTLLYHPDQYRLIFPLKLETDKCAS